MRNKSTLVRSTLDYGLYNGLATSNDRSGSRYTSEIPWRPYGFEYLGVQIMEVVRCLDLLPLHTRCKRSDLLVLYKLVNGVVDWSDLQQSVITPRGGYCFVANNVWQIKGTTVDW